MVLVLQPICQDGIQWLYTMLDEGAPVDMIVPAIPVHVVSDWLKLNIQKMFDNPTD
jgi:hypothetical protein